MKKLIIMTLTLALYANVSHAAFGDITERVMDVKQSIVAELKSTINTLKSYFKSAEDEMMAHRSTFEDQQQTADALYAASQTAEANVTVMNHGKSNMPSCGNSKELYWTGSQWSCRDPLYNFDCNVASDEYKSYHSSTALGPNYVCTKGPNGSGPNYYWKFRGYSDQCVGTYRKKIKGCFYDNKLGETIEVSASHCAGKYDPSVNKPNLTCYSPWRLTSYGSCQSDTYKYRNQYCPSGYVCIDPDIPDSDLRTRCVSSHKYSSWSECSASCGGGTKTRSYYGCATNHYCPGSVTTSTSCNTQECPPPPEENEGWRDKHDGQDEGMW